MMLQELRHWKYNIEKHTFSVKILVITYDLALQIECNESEGDLEFLNTWLQNMILL